jgi:FkbM family methyltransferase
MKTLWLYSKLRLISLFSWARAKFAGPYCEGFLSTANGVHVIAAVRDVGVGRRLAFKGEYDSEHLRQYRALISPDSRVLVVGTHVGSILLPLAKIAREVVGVAANPETFKLLGMNIAINGLVNCQIHNLAAFDSQRSLDFVASTVSSGGAKVMPHDHRFEFFYDEPSIIKVQGTRLDDVIAGRFDLVIMDIEGAEYRAMAGMQRILSEAKHFVCELVPNHMEHADQCTLEQFAARIPANFTKFSLTTNPTVVGRVALPKLYNEVREQFNFGGSDLVCSEETSESRPRQP